jgi:hypothetical protein
MNEGQQWRFVRARLFILSASVILLVIAALGQLTVDATGPIRERRRKAGMGRGGSIGRKLPLQVAIKTTGAPPDENGKTLVEFILTNAGKNDLALPISPHPGDLEPSDPKATYTGRLLALFVTSDKRQTNILSGDTHLYGSDAVPGTLITLTPGEFIQVLVRVALPRISASEPSASEPSALVFVGHAMLDNETIKTFNGQAISDTQEIGSASSPKYTPEHLK